VDGDRAELAYERQRCETDLRARRRVEDGAAGEGSGELELQRYAALRLRAGDGVVGGLLGVCGGWCFDGATDGVAGSLISGESPLFDAGEGDDDKT
jgi:hypothetical protein